MLKKVNYFSIQKLSVIYAQMCHICHVRWLMYKMLGSAAQVGSMPEYFDMRRCDASQLSKAMYAACGLEHPEATKTKIYVSK